MDTVQQILEWAKANPWTATAIVVYVIANLAPRPNPEKMKGWQRALWQIIDRLCLLTSHRVPGSLKFLLLDSPVQGSDGEVEKEPKVPDESDDSEDEDGESDEDEVDSKDEPAVVVDTDDPPDELDEDGAEEKGKGSDNDG